MMSSSSFRNEAGLFRDGAFVRIDREQGAAVGAEGSREASVAEIRPPYAVAKNSSHLDSRSDIIRQHFWSSQHSTLAAHKVAR